MPIEALKKIYTVNLTAIRGEKALVFTDTITSGAAVSQTERVRREGLVRVARAAADAGRSLGLEVRYLEYPALGSPGLEPGRELWRLAFGDDAVDALEGSGLLGALMEKRADEAQMEEARAVVKGLAGDSVDVVVALSNFSTTHTRFRALLTEAAGARYASMPMFEEDMLYGSMDVDWEAVEKRCGAVAGALEDGESVRLTTDDGTDISFGIKGRKVYRDTGILKEPGSVSNLPAGEVYLAPVEGTADGILVLNWAPDRRLASPLRAAVKGGLVTGVTGDDPYVDELRANLERRPDNRNLAELGIGTNEKAKRPDNILESEKIMGTVHMAFGDNTSMGGSVSAPFHQDFVFFGPTLVVRTAQGEERTILDRGRLLFG